MRIRPRIAFVLVLATAGIAGDRPISEPREGAVVEAVAKGLAADRAGFQEGDVILSWTRGDSKGDVESPFDVSAVDIEQALHGNVTFAGFRGPEKHTWTLGPDKWGLETRPVLIEPILSIYQEGEELAKARKLAEAAGRWRLAAETARSLQPSLLAPWLLSRAGGLLAEAQLWKEADLAYKEALDLSQDKGAWIASQLLEQWAKAFERRHDWSAAERCHLQALEERRKLNPESLAVAESLMSLAENAWHREDMDKTEAYILQALAIREKLIPESLSVAWCFNDLGLIAWRKGDLAKAENYHHQALAMREKLAPNSVDVAASLDNLAIVLREHFDLEEADQYLQRSLAIHESLEPDSAVVSSTLVSIANVAFDRGDLAKAREYYQKQLTLIEKLDPESPNVAVGLTNLANVAVQQGDLATAEEQYLHALALFRKVAPNGLYAALTLVDLSGVAERRGDLEEAEKLLRNALMVQNKQAANSIDTARTLANLGKIAMERGKLEVALQYERQALAIRQTVAPESIHVASSLTHLGVLAGKLGNTALAEKNCQRALAIEEKVAPTSLEAADTLSDLSDLFLLRGDLAQAEAFRRRAIVILEKLVPESKIHAESLAALASILYRKGDTVAAAPLFAQALNVLDHQIARLGGREETRIGFRVHYASYYSDYIELLMGQHQSELAFEVAERSRARSLLEMLAAGRIEVRQGVDPDLLHRAEALRQLIAFKSNRRVRLLTAQHADHQVAVIDKEIREVRIEYETLEGRLRASSPGYAALTQIQPLSADQVRQLLDGDTLLLEYFLGEKHSYVWAITETSITSYELPKPAQIEALARHLYKLVSVPNQTEAATGERQRRLQGAVTALSSTILGPVALQLGNRRLLIVTDGALQYIPFSVLPDLRKSSQPLVVDHEVAYVPSASVLDLIRRRAPAATHSTGTVAVLADPVFTRLDPRVRPERFLYRQRVEAPTRLLADKRVARTARDVGWQDLPRLPFSREEANAISAVTPPQQRLMALGFAASRAMATSPEPGKYRIVHFATHALLDEKNPQDSGLVLSMVDRAGQPQDGFLGLEDIYNLNLPVDLVVLSACKTGLGKKIKGEGLMGLTRGFMHAGARRVLATLWSVDDAATAQLMKRVYKAMLMDGLEPAAALRRAQLQMWRQATWNHPYNWGAFILQGEWKPSLEFTAQH